jgi:molybdopterin molybdotransferase
VTNVPGIDGQKERVVMAEQKAFGSQSALDVAQARQLILDALTAPGGREQVAVRSALGRVLARDVVAPFDVPAHDNSAMDGYAVRFADLAAGGETALEVVGTALAGGAFSGLVGPGQAVRIMTGAVIPRGADTVVVQEVVTVAGNRVRIPAGQELGQNLRRAGEDLAKGRSALAAGKRVGAVEIGLLASLGFVEVSVYRRLRVAFFSTGDELASLGRALAPGEVYDSNRYTLYGALTQLGVDLLDMGVVRDEPAAMEQAFRDAVAQADVILTTGGVSVGEADYVKDIVNRLGAVTFWKINIKPGRPMAFGRIAAEGRQAWLFGLPGNPVAVIVNFHQIVLDALLKLMGVAPLPKRPLLRLPCASALHKGRGRREFPRGMVFEEQGVWQVRVAGNQGSGVLRSMSEANCYIVLPEDCTDVAAGEAVMVQLFTDFSGL